MSVLSPSSAVTVMNASPDSPSAGVIFIWRLTAWSGDALILPSLSVPMISMPDSGTSEGTSDTAVTLRTPPSGSVTVKAIFSVGVSSSVLWLRIMEISGPSFTGLTMR